MLNVTAVPNPHNGSTVQTRLEKAGGWLEYEQYVRVKPETGCEALGPSGLNSRPVNNRLLLS